MSRSIYNIHIIEPLSAVIYALRAAAGDREWQLVFQAFGNAKQKVEDDETASCTGCGVRFSLQEQAICYAICLPVKLVDGAAGFAAAFCIDCYEKGPNRIYEFTRAEAARHFGDGELIIPSNAGRA